jgi:hypothetical protein
VSETPRRHAISVEAAAQGLQHRRDRTQAAAVMSAAPRHPKALAIAGAKKPLISRPAGTAVCLIENTSGARR